MRWWIGTALFLGACGGGGAIAPDATPMVDAATGTRLDPTFGTDGIVQIPSSSWLGWIALDADDTIDLAYVSTSAVYCRIDATGAPIGDCAQPPHWVGPLRVVADGALVAGQGAIAHYDRQPRLERELVTTPSFVRLLADGADTIAIGETYDGATWHFVAARIDASDTVAATNGLDGLQPSDAAIGGGRIYISATTASGGRILALDATTLAIDPAFDVTSDVPFGAIALTSAGELVAATTCAGGTCLRAFGADGAPSWTIDHLGGGGVADLEDEGGHLDAVLQYSVVINRSSAFVARWDETGAPDPSFGMAGEFEQDGARQVRARPDGELVVLGNTEPDQGIFLARVIP